MDLIVNNKLIEESISNILTVLKQECDPKYLNYIGSDRGGDIKITCPWHKNGQEDNPSCHIFTRSDDPNIYKGTVHCFTCGKQVPFYSLVGQCFNSDDNFGKQWLADNFGNTTVSTVPILPEIIIPNKVNKINNYLDESILQKYNYYHPYMQQRHLNLNVIQQFKIGYDPETNCITFPLWDWSGGLVEITRRSVGDKVFNLASDQNKPVYLLNFIRQYNITKVYIVESQINALTLWGWNYPAVALLGTGSKYQYDILRKSGIRNYILCFDGDEAGDKGRVRFIQNMNSDVLISSKVLPRGKDVNDLTKEEFEELPII